MALPFEKTGSITVYLRDENGDILFASGTTLPSNSTTGYAKGCVFIDTDVAGGTGSFNLNKGTKTSCTFSLVTQA
jgi:hypothetical protein